MSEETMSISGKSLKIKSTQKNIIIFSYLAAIVIKIFYSIISSKGAESGCSYLILVIYGCLAFFTYKGNIIATWLMIVSVLMTGLGTFFVGLFLVTMDQAVIKAIFIFSGLYFIYGGIKLILIRRKEKSDGSSAKHSPA